MSLALTNQILFAQIRVPALQNILKSRSLSSLLRAGIRLILHRRFSIDNRADLPRIRKVDAFDNNKITAERGVIEVTANFSRSRPRRRSFRWARGTPADLFSAIERTRRSRLRSFRQERRSQSHGLIQRPRDDGGCVQGMERGTNALICASTGNTSASAAAYAARAGISCVVILPCGKNCDREIASGFCLWSENRRDRRQFR
jgi:Threonine synthase